MKYRSADSWLSVHPDDGFVLDWYSAKPGIEQRQKHQNAQHVRQAHTLVKRNDPQVDEVWIICIRRTVPNSRQNNKLIPGIVIL